ncbi:hypothetical protein [Burkholderia ambifaria]|uniref:hypothetical protein n=1 Tax=Burkholderia ambifaria TaxID=152480 RepID=UPI001592245A|nr:hypothetical protein [Burkholderia ambifaria]
MNRLEQLDQFTVMILSALEQNAGPANLRAKQFVGLKLAPDAPDVSPDELCSEQRLFSGTMCWLASIGYLTFSSQSSDDFYSVVLTASGHQALRLMRQRLHRVSA